VSVSIVISRLEKIDAIVTNEIDDPMLLGEGP
jgi:hypothetical protein